MQPRKMTTLGTSLALLILCSCELRPGAGFPEAVTLERGVAALMTGVHIDGDGLLVLYEDIENVSVVGKHRLAVAGSYRLVVRFDHGKSMSDRRGTMWLDSITVTRLDTGIWIMRYAQGGDWAWRTFE